jgi:hypothetical protein
MASDVASGYCYIDRHCYADGASSPYSGSECRKCDAAVDPLQWSSPDTSAACFIDGTCVASGAHAQVSVGYSTVDDPCLHCDPSTNSSDYSPVAGCELPSTFEAGCYTDSGSQVMTMAAMTAQTDTFQQTIASQQTTVTSMQTLNTQLTSDVDSLNGQKTILQNELDSVTSDEESCGDVRKITIALIVVVGVMLLITSVSLVILVVREKKGYPMFAPPGVAMGTPPASCAMGTPVAGNATEVNSPETETIGKDV